MLSLIFSGITMRTQMLNTIKSGERQKTLIYILKRYHINEEQVLPLIVEGEN